VVKQIAELGGVHKINVVDTTVDDGIVIKCSKRSEQNEGSAQGYLRRLRRAIRPPPNAAP